MRKHKYRAWDERANRPVMPDSFLMHPDGDKHAWMNQETRYSPYHSDNIILMQYTGLKDKNGKEIYEGDVLRVLDRSHEPDLEVVGDMSDWLLNYGWASEEMSSLYKDMEVIGNIYSNPDLLTEDNES